MRTRKTLGIGLFSVVAVSLALAGTQGQVAGAAQESQSQGSAQNQEPTIRSRVDLVNLFATVRDNKKRIITDLTKDDFVIEEDGNRQTVEFFSRETEQPITLGLLIDTSGSQEFVLGAEQEAAGEFLRRVMRPKKDLAMVINFDLDVDLLSDWTSDVEKLERAVGRARINAPRQVTPGPFPDSRKRGTVFYDAIYVACREKLAGEAGRKALVILTDGADYGSRVSLDAALEAAQKTDTVIHVLLISDPRSDGYGRGEAKKLAEETGGRIIDVHNEKDLQKAFEQISEELRTQYMLGYTSTNKTRDGRFRKIKMETRRDNTKVLARKGYYAPVEGRR